MAANQPQPQKDSVLRVMQSKAETRAYYDKISAIYDLMAEHSEGPVRQSGLEKLAVKPGERVLEIGYGTGHSLVELARAVGPEGKVFGIDLSEGMRARAEERLAAENLVARVELRCGDATQLPYADGSMNGVFMSFTLELFDTPEIPQVLAECRRVLVAGGRIGVVAITKEGKEGFAIEAYEWTHRHFPNLLDCRPIFVRRALEDAGFSIQAAAVTNMWVPVEIVVAQKVRGAGGVGTQHA